MTHLGELCALLAPLAWSFAIVLYRRSDVAPLAMNLFKNTFAVVALTLTMIALGIEVPAERPLWDWMTLIVSGLLGLAIADTLFFEGLRRVGAGGIAIVDTIYAPVVVAMSWLLLSESPSTVFLGGAAAVVGGITIATLRPGEAPRSRNEWIGIAYGLTAIFCTATAVVVAKPVLEGSDLVEVTWTRLVAGVLGQLVWLGWTGQMAAGTAAFRPTNVWWTLVPGAFVGCYVSMLLWLGGYKWADASVAATLNQMATVYLLVQARFVLGERLRRAQVVGALIAASGALWIVLSGT